LKVLRKEFPKYNYHSEEEGISDNGSEYTLIIDPLDGTNNFVLGIPNFSISIGLLRKDEFVAGVVHLPFLSHTYWAEKGKGAFLDDAKLHVGTESEISKSSIAIVCGYINQYEFSSELIKRLNDQRLKRPLTNWSPAYDFCLLASGKIEAIVHNNPEIYDYAAGKLIAAEAGALITDLSGKPVPDKECVFVASNGSMLHKKLLDILPAICG